MTVVVVVCVRVTRSLRPTAIQATAPSPNTAMAMGAAKVLLLLLTQDRPERQSTDRLVEDVVQHGHEHCGDQAA